MLSRIRKISLAILLSAYLASPAMAYDFDSSSGLMNTGGNAGYNIAQQADLSLADKIGYYTGVVISFVGVLFLGLAIYAGFRWMNARGNDAEVGAAKKILEQAVIGLLIAISAYAVTFFVSQVLFSSTVKSV